MELVFVAAVLSVCCLFATAVPPQASVPWRKLSAASQSVYRNTDDILRFEPITSIDSVWEAFKSEHGMRHVHTSLLKCIAQHALHFRIGRHFFWKIRLSQVNWILLFLADVDKTA